MAVAHDAASESHTGTTGSTSEASFTWNHTPSGTPRGVTVFVISQGSTDLSTGVTYGGTALSRVTGGIATDSAGEAGVTAAWHLGASVSTGVQAVVVSRTNNAQPVYAVAVTQTAGADTEPAPSPVLLQGDGTLAEQNVDDGSPGTNSVRYAGMSSGLTVPPAAGANSTALHSIAFGSRSAAVVQETTAGQGSRPVGFSSGTSDDRAAVHLAIREISGGGGGTTIARQMLQFHG